MRERGLLLPAQLQLEQLGERRVGSVALLLGRGVETQRRPVGIAARPARSTTVVARRPVVPPVLARTLLARPVPARTIRAIGAWALARTVARTLAWTLGPVAAWRVGEELALVG